MQRQIWIELRGKENTYALCLLLCIVLYASSPRVNAWLPAAPSCLHLRESVLPALRTRLVSSVEARVVHQKRPSEFVAGCFTPKTWALLCEIVTPTYDEVVY